MPNGYTIRDVAEDLKFLLSLTGIFEADDEGYWIDASSKQRFKYSLDKNDIPREVVVFQETIPDGDVLFFNPFAEGLGTKSPIVTFYYNAVRIAFTTTLRQVILFSAREMLRSKQAHALKEDYVSHPAMVRMNVVPISKKTTVFDEVDEVMITEFTTLLDRVNDELLFVVYNSRQMEAKVNCAALTDEDFDAKFGDKIRKKSLSAFKALLMGVLGIKTPEELATFSVKYSTTDSSKKTSPKFFTVMSVFLNLYAKFNDVIADAYGTDGVPNDRFVIDLDQFQNVIERFPAAYAIAKHMFQPVLPTQVPTSTQTIDTGGLQIGGDPNNRPGGRFSPHVVGEQSAPASGGFQTGSTSRFQPHVINPGMGGTYQPAFNMQPQMGPVGGFGQFQPAQPQNTFGGGFSGGLDLTPPSNFYNPNTRRNW